MKVGPTYNPNRWMATCEVEECYWTTASTGPLAWRRVVGRATLHGALCHPGGANGLTFTGVPRDCIAVTQHLPHPCGGYYVADASVIGPGGALGRWLPR